MSKQELKILKKGLKGPIQEIENPDEFSVEEILSSYFLEILFLARKYTRPKVEYEDLVVEGLMGLMDAIERWDPEKAKGNRRAFHNLAIVRIKSHMFEYFLANSSLYKVPSYMARAISLVEQIQNHLGALEYGGDAYEDLLSFEAPAFEESAPHETIAAVKRLKERLLTIARNSGKTYREMVEDVLKIEQDMEAHENQESIEITPEQEAAQRDFLEKFLTNLSPVARDVISLRLQGLTLDDVGAQKGFTRERARQIEERAIKWLRRTRMYKDVVEE